MELSRGGKAPQAEAKRLVDPAYFASQKPNGPAKLVDMLEESAIWTSNLAAIAAREAWLLFFGLCIAVGLALFAAAIVVSPSVWQLGARIVMAIQASLLSADFLGAALAYGAARDAAKRVIDRLQPLKGDAAEIQPFMPILGDYNSAVEAMPPFSSGLYPRHEKRLNDEYRMFLTGPQ